MPVVLVTFVAVVGVRVPLVAGQEVFETLLGLAQQRVEGHGLGVGVSSEAGSASSTAGQSDEKRESGDRAVERGVT